MGCLVNGTWTADEGAMFKADGTFDRPESTLRGWVVPQDAVPGRYHLYAMLGCPWAHRTLITRALLGLEDVISLSLVTMRPTPTEGWVFDSADPTFRDDLGGRRALHQVYSECAEGYSGRATVPVLVDKRTGRIVNNESADIIRMLATSFARVASVDRDLAPAALLPEIDEVNARVYEGLNHGVYRAGFAQTWQAHTRAKAEVFATLDWLEARLEGREWLCGDALTEADVRLLPTLLRFEGYHDAFLCNDRRLESYPNLLAFTARMRALPGVEATLLPSEAYAMGYRSIPFAAVHRWGAQAA